jgi:hypothetical protein
MVRWDWHLSATEVRHLRLLEHMIDLGPGIHDLAEFYDNDSSRTSEAFRDVEYLDQRGFLDAALSMGGLEGVSASIETPGAEYVDKARALRGGRSGRQWACRTSMLSWLYDEEAVGSLSQSVTWDGFATDLRSLYYGEPFRADEQDAAAAWLRRNGFIDGVVVAQADGPVRCFVTDVGERCAERFDCDVRRYLEVLEQQPVGTTTWNVTGEQVQIATGDDAQQVIKLGATAEQIKLALQGVVELLRSAAVPPETIAGAEELASKAVADLESDSPTGEPTRQFLSWVKECIRNGGAQAVVAAITAMSSGILADVERFIHAIGG